jgi:hypothetical protein
MMSLRKILLCCKVLLLIVALQHSSLSRDYFVHPKLGKVNNPGTSKQYPFKHLTSIATIKLRPGDRVFLASNQTFTTGLHLINQRGEKNKPILISSFNWETSDESSPAVIDCKGQANGILIQDCSFIEVRNLHITGNGYFEKNEDQKMRCGILIHNHGWPIMEQIVIDQVTINDIFYENPGFQRGQNEVKTANGTQKYGWGIRIINNDPNAVIKDIIIKHCDIENLSHTGIKLTGHSKNIRDVKITANTLKRTGGPGIQMSEVKNVYVAENIVSHSGSPDDSRKWGRGSGLWTWGSSNVLIEKNKFLYANGPGDSAGAHIDFNCDNVVLQYNISAHNAGGFCEILGNNYNCCYRYNVSINDGYRTKGINGAFQEGKIFWLSGYVGEKKPKKGPVNSYFYNNTIYCDTSMVAKMALERTSKGILIANNIFYFKGKSKTVLGDQNNPDSSSEKPFEDVFFKNNLFLSPQTWPIGTGIEDVSPIFGDPQFKNSGGLNSEDYIPKNLSLIHRKGINVSLLADNTIGLLFSLHLKKDLMGNAISDLPSIGAIEPH